jgi:RNA polymerase sigma-70 factor, ECF subfamily
VSYADLSAQFADQLEAVQRGLYAYILTLMPWPDEASDVLQQTNLVLWRDAARFHEGTNFRAWAYRVAYFQVLAWRRKSQRDRLQFDEGFLKNLANDAESQLLDTQEEVFLLRQCLKELSANERELISRRYDAGMSVQQLSAEVSEAPNTIAVRLFRIRQALLDCIRRKMLDGNSR